MECFRSAPPETIRWTSDPARPWPWITASGSPRLTLRQTMTALVLALLIDVLLFLGASAGTPDLALVTVAGPGGPPARTHTVMLVS